MSDTAMSAPRVAINYRNGFVVALIGVSLIAPILSILNFEITNASVYALTMTWSLLVVLGGAHVWITLAYYFDRRWLAQFRQAPTIYFVIPFLVVAVSTVLMLNHNMMAGLSLVYGAIVVNIWHHAKQNWGILSLVAKCRAANVASMRLPLVYAWPFFIASIFLYLPKLTEITSVTTLRSIALALAGTYVIFSGLALWRARALASRDPMLYVLSASLCLYFLPLAALNGKPYALLITFGAHALQYYLLVFMSLSLSTRRFLDLKGLAPKMIIVAVVITGATYAGYQASLNYGPPDLWDSVWVRLVVGLTTGVNFVHFWLDAFLWKFSDKRTREAHGDAFAF